MAVDWQLGWATIVREFEGVDPEEVEPYYSADPEPNTGASVEFSGPVLASSTVVCSVGYRWYDPATETESERIGAIGVEQSSGAIRWSRPLGDVRTTDTTEVDPNVRSLDYLTWSGAEVVGEAIVVPAVLESGMGVAVLDGETGTLRDELDLGLSEAFGRPRVADGFLYVVDAPDDVRLHAFDLDTGAEEWSADVDVLINPRSPDLPPISFENQLLWTVERPKGLPEIVARDAGDGSEQVRESIDLPDIRSNLVAPSFGPEYAYAAGNFSARLLREATPLVSIDPADGTERWRYAPPTVERKGKELGGIYGFPLVVDDSVIATGWGPPDDADSDGAPYLLAVNESDGSLKWTLELEIPHTVPVVAGDMIYLGTPTISAISPDGEPIDAITGHSASPHQSSPALGNGHLYLAGSRALLAIE